jgi:hypothetical protein
MALAFFVLLQDESRVGRAVAISFPVLGMLAFGPIAFGLWRKYRHERASDVEIDDSGLRFVAGRLDGHVIAWGEIDSCAIATDASRYIQRDSGVGRVVSTEYLQQLWLTRRGNPRPPDLLLAESLDPEEKLSLQELQQSIVGACEARGRLQLGPAPQPPSASVLQCTACGFPVSPRETAPTVCASCGVEVQFDAETRERIGAALALGQQVERLEASVVALLQQPSARATNIALGLFAKLLFGVPAGALILYFTPDPGILRALLLLAVGIPLMTAAALAARMQTVARRALRDLTIGMGARNPSRPGEPSRCRQCGGTLVIRPGRVVALCLFCNAENLLGLDLRPAAAEARSRLYHLEPILQRQAGQRRVARAGAVICCALAALALAVFG